MAFSTVGNEDCQDGHESSDLSDLAEASLHFTSSCEYPISSLFSVLSSRQYPTPCLILGSFLGAH